MSKDTPGPQYVWKIDKKGKKGSVKRGQTPFMVRFILCPYLIHTLNSYPRGRTNI